MVKTMDNIGNEHQLLEARIQDAARRGLLPAVEAPLLQVDSDLQFVPPADLEYELAMSSARVIVAGVMENLE